MNKEGLETTMKNSCIDRSIPESRKVRGFEIKRMPIGAFLQAAQLLQNAPERLAKALFPEEQDVLAKLRGIDKSALQRLLLRGMAVLPEQVVELFAQLSGIPQSELLENPAIGLDGLAEMAEAWAEVNGIENFIRLAGGLADRVRKMTTPAGFNG